MRFRALILALLVLPFAIFRWLMKSGGSACESLPYRDELNQDRTLGQRPVLRTVLWGLLAGAVIVFAGVVLFAYSGLYRIHATEPHTRFTAWLLQTGKRNAVQFHARDVQPVPLRDAAAVRQGFVVYRENCLACHGAPGVARGALGRGIQPTPPPIVRAVPAWSDAELYWIVTHGLKFSGMPGFLVSLTDTQRWASVAFLRQLAWASPMQYRKWASAVEGAEKAAGVEWLVEDRESFAVLNDEGDPQRGRTLLGQFGCGACHLIPRAGTGTVGPPLEDFSERHFIAGKFVNTPRNVVDFIVDPQRFRPRTAMPNLAVTPEEAFHMVAYLYTLGEGERVSGLLRYHRRPQTGDRSRTRQDESGKMKDDR